MLWSSFSYLYLCDIRLHMFAASQEWGSKSLSYGSSVFMLMRWSDWFSPLISLPGLRFWLWCCDLGQWLRLCADYPRSSEWKHPGGLCGVFPPARQGKCRPHITTCNTSHRHYRLFRAHRGPNMLAFVLCYPCISISFPLLPLSFWSWCVVALMGMSNEMMNTAFYF